MQVAASRIYILAAPHLNFAVSKIEMACMMKTSGCMAKQAMPVAHAAAPVIARPSRAIRKVTARREMHLANVDQFSCKMSN